ncbi:metal-sensing transcriptional repressor [Tepidibacillus fermentans]|uniref:DNA-binding FrmR family transcriptional regulator n=1 Tax=Tepidibacillus fermentans TaxID=1281767 RepID=A0A4R3KIV4_9BACI|nr:metal-sensing transcriptional repressor [Tepidibacillus fermentans]TCS83515.1 DNA-binding FrmR family transcriptional regulator [Tepidibacillus fermentans]
MEYPTDVLNRMKRVEGQIRGVLKMMEDGKACEDVIHQLSAIRNAVDRIIVNVVGVDMGNCLVEHLKDKDQLDTDKIIKDTLQLLLKIK